MTQLLPIAPAPAEASEVFADTVEQCLDILNDLYEGTRGNFGVRRKDINWGHVGTVSALCELLRQAQEVCEGLSETSEGDER